MAEKVQIEKPVVSKELAEAFEDVNKVCSFVSYIVNGKHFHYNVPEKNEMAHGAFENLLARMYVLGYEVEKPKRYVLQIPIKDDDDGTFEYLYRNANGRPVYHWLSCDKDVINNAYYSDGFTKSEIEADEGLKKNLLAYVN